MSSTKKVRTLEIVLHGLLYNNDMDILGELLKKDKKYNVFDKETEASILNIFKINIHDDDFIEVIKKKIILFMLEKLKDEKTCLFCFDNDKKNEYVDIGVYKKSTPRKPKGFTNIDEKAPELDGINFDILNGDIDIDFDQDIDFDMAVDDDLDFDIQEGGGKSKAFCCHNCMKVYQRDSMELDIENPDNYENYKDFFPMIDSLYLWLEKDDEEVDDIQISHSIVKKSRNDFISFEIGEDYYINPYDYIDNINEKFLKSRENRKTDIIRYLSMYKNKDNYYQKHIDNSARLLEEFYDVEQDEHDLSNIKVDKFKNLQLAYFPEIAMFYNRKNNKYKCIELYNKLYFPYVDFKTFYINFILKDKEDRNLFVSCFENTQFKNDHYNIEDFILNWYEEMKHYDTIIKSFESLNIKKEHDIFTTKIFYDFNNDNHMKQSNILIFSNIYQLFEMSEKIPYLNTYLSEESQILEKYYAPLEEKLQKYEWSIQNKNIIQFKMLLNKNIKQIDGSDQKEDYYIQINLYNTSKIEVTISLPIVSNIFVSREDINNYVQQDIFDFIIYLNTLNIFNLNYNEIQLDSPTVNSINFYFKIPSKYDFDMIQDQLISLQKCLYPYFIRDFDDNVKTFRYTRIKNVEESNLYDKFIYQAYKSFEVFTDDEKQIDENIIASLMLTFKIDELRAEYIYGNYKTRFKNFNIKPPSFGIFFNISEPEFWEKKFIKLSGMGLRSFDDLNKFRDFLAKIYYLLDLFSSGKKTFSDKNVQTLYDLCFTKQLTKKVILDKDEIIELQQEKMQCGFDLNVIEEKLSIKEYKKEEKDLIKRRGLIKKRLGKLENEIEKKKKEFKKKNTKGYVRFLTRLQQKYPQLTINPCSSEDGNQYSKQCQRRRQPMGTGEGFQPDIIDFNTNLEKDKLKELENITCKIEVDQEGGGQKRENYLKMNSFERENIYATWGIKYKPEIYKNKMNVNDCQKGKSIEKSYKIKDLKIIVNDYYKINAEEVQKNDICVILKQLENIKDISIMYKKLYSTGNFDSNEDKEVLKNIIAVRESRFQYVKSSALSKDFIKEILKELNIKKKPYDKEFKSTLIDLLENDQDKLLILTKLDHIKNILSKENIVIRLVYELINLYTSWSNTEMEVFMKLTGSKSETNLRDMLTKFEDEYMKYNQTTKKQKLSDMKLKQFVEETEMLIRKDEMNNVIQSVLKFNNKALTCPNYDDNKNNSMVGFLDIPINQIPVGKTDSAIRQEYCLPCCFAGKKDSKTGETTLSANYLKNVLFCTGKISFEEYKNIIESEQRGENYISTNYNINNVNNYGILQPELNKFFNNFTNFYNIVKKKDIKNPLMSKFKNNLLKSNGFVLQGINQQNTFLNNILTALDYSKDELIEEIEEYLMKNPIIFGTLNEGGLFLRFKTMESYIDYLDEEIVKPEYILDIISRKGVLSRFENGINVFIFTENENVIDLEYYDEINNYTDNKTHIYVYQHENGFYELIILKLYGEDENIRYFDKQEKYQLLKNKEMKDVLDEMYTFIEKWYSHASNENKNLINTLVEKLDSKNITGQIVDKFKKTLFVIYKDVLIPVKPMGYNPDIPIINKDKPALTYINKYKKSLKSTMKYIDLFADKIGNKRYRFYKYVTKNNKILGIELRNGLLIDVIPEPLTSDIRIYQRSDKNFFYEINDILFENRNNKKTTVNDIKKSYDEEIFNLFKLEVSKYLAYNQSVKDDIIKIINDKYDKIYDKEKLLSMDSFYLKLTDIVTKIYGEIVSDIENDDLIAFNDNKSNIRKSCFVNNKKDCSINSFCSYDLSTCKLKVPLYKKNMFISLFTSELLMNSTFSEIILKDKVNTIVNKNDFKNNDTNVFRKKNIVI